MMNSGQIQFLTAKAHYWFRKNAIMQKGSLMKIPHLQVLKEKKQKQKEQRSRKPSSYQRSMGNSKRIQQNQLLTVSPTEIIPSKNVCQKGNISRHLDNVSLSIQLSKIILQQKGTYNIFSEILDCCIYAIVWTVNNSIEIQYARFLV